MRLRKAALACSCKTYVRDEVNGIGQFAGLAYSLIFVAQAQVMDEVTFCLSLSEKATRKIQQTPGII